MAEIGGIEGKVDVAELMGASEHLHLKVNDKDVIVIVPTEGADEAFNKKAVKITFSGNTCHVFSKETGKNLEY